MIRAGQRAHDIGGAAARGDEAAGRVVVADEHAAERTVRALRELLCDGERERRLLLVLPALDEPEPDLVLERHVDTVGK